jgi:dolichol-phosphate mannosyltransferase
MSLVSIIIPVYYNAASLPALAARLAEMAAAHPHHDFEFIYVDDGSGDDSFAILERLAHTDPHIRVVKLTRNFGSNTAILAGLTYARGDCVGFIAADLQDPPETMSEMIGRWENGCKAVLAVRHDRLGDPLSTRIFAGVFNWLFKKLVFQNFSPQGVGFFLIDRQVVRAIVDCNERNAHLVGLILWSGYAYDVVEYERVQREHGKSRWTFRKKLKYFVDAFTAFSYLPLRAASALGLVLAALGGLYALVVILVRLTSGVQAPGWAALTVVVLLTSGVQLVMLGVIGEYLWRNFDATRRRPLFLVETEINTRRDEVS